MIQQNQPFVDQREITSDQQVQNIAKIERIDEEEPSSQDSNLMSRKVSTFNFKDSDEFVSPVI